MMLLIALGPSACEVITADSDAILNLEDAAQRVNDHLRSGGEVLCREHFPEGDAEFWQNKMRRGLEP